MQKRNIKIGILGLGYVGLPLLVELSRHFHCVGFDISNSKVNDLNNSIDKTNELLNDEISLLSKIKITSNLKDLDFCNFFIVTVPTPVKSNNKPDLAPLKKACKSVGSIIKRNDIVVFESTVYPGCTNEFCVPIIEEVSKLKLNKDFYVGYSPERINPGDKNKRLPDITKVISASNEYALNIIDIVYSSIIKAGIFTAKTIEVAEAAKVIENSQRDLNIAFVNELSMIFNKMGINTKDVLDAASTKWNFLRFEPGLVGGHCIGVDPYYLTYKAKKIGIKPKVILAGREINDSMPMYVFKEFCKLLDEKNIKKKSAKILLLGIAFKEDCPDFRNSKSIELYNLFKDSNYLIDVHDPIVDENDLYKSTNIKLSVLNSKYDGIIFSVAHKQYKNNYKKYLKMINKTSVIFDVKNILPSSNKDGNL